METEESKAEKPAFRFLSFANVEEDAEKAAKLKEAAARLEEAIAKERTLSELVDYKEDNSDGRGPQADSANDTRSLYERLQEVRDKKKNDLEESKKLSNLITKLDEDDVEYLNEVAKKKRGDELRKRLEIQDALEAKRILDEQKMAEQERKMKQSLLGKTVPTHKSSLSKLMIRSKIKVKPKSDEHVKTKLSEARLTTASTDTTDTPGSTQLAQNDTGGTSRGRSESNRDTDAMGSDASKNEDKPSGKRDDTKKQGEPPSRSEEICTCSHDVMTSIGVLASLPIVGKFRDSSDDDSDARSEDDLERRLVPRTCKRRR